jgi:hypothetical protein
MPFNAGDQDVLNALLLRRSREKHWFSSPKAKRC